MPEGCPKCHASVSVEANFCQNCGHNLKQSAAAAVGVTLGKLVFGLFLALAALGFGGFGACLMIFSTEDHQSGAGMLAVGMGLLGAAVGCLTLLVRVLKS